VHAACTLARSPIRDPLPEGFRHFVTSMTAPALDQQATRASDIERPNFFEGTRVAKEAAAILAAAQTPALAAAG
jgi:hypothetical protein